MTKNKTKVVIDNIEYRLSGFESEEYMHRVAIYVDKKIKSTRLYSDALNTTLIAVLTSLNIADELMKEKLKVVELESRLEEISSSIGTSNQSNIMPFNINL